MKNYIVEIEDIGTFERLAAQVKEDAQREKDDFSEFIENGYLSTWGEGYEQNDNGIKKHSTAARWEQYTNGEITREKAVELATKRVCKAIDKETAEELERLERVANAPDLEYISIQVEWRKSATWGMNPYATVHTGAESASGYASGCGYDKESTAIANALNQCDSVLKALYTYKENRMKEGQSDSSRTTCTGHGNRTIIGYGSGCSTIPAFEGGTGVSCFWAIFEKLGYKTTGGSGKHSAYYHISKI